MSNLAALEPLYRPWEVPNKHRVRGRGDGDPAVVESSRRPSPVSLVNNLRHEINEWRKDDVYAGVSETSRELLLHWFGRDHTASGSPFRYYFCQREAIETLIYLHEARGLRSLSALTAEYDNETAALGIDPEQDLWPKYAFKVATGAGKTKIMSLAIVWSYFHALRESDSPMARHFVLIAPNLTVFERLKEDFGGGKIFDTDPLIPSHWRGDWNMSVTLQDEASGASSGGMVYLTNIHQLYTPRTKTREVEMQDWLGPAISRAKALDTGAALRERIFSHPRLMVLNDEAHHVWDPESAWNEAIRGLHQNTQSRYGNQLIAQLDFSATPKDNKGNLFQHIVCDTPLGEAVDAGIVKIPIIGSTGQLHERADENAAYRYEEHLLAGYARWLKSVEEWKASGKKPLIFVMCTDTEAADQITNRLNSDPAFEQLNGKTLNLHTNLKGKVVKRGKGDAAIYEFVESVKDISDEDLRALRQISRQLDDNSSPYQCIVSVLMLREGWDVRNVTTIVPLRPYSSKANILPEQTLGRGLRRMTSPVDGVIEMVSVIEHAAFTRMYRDELSQQGVMIEVTDADKVPRTTVTIFPDKEKDLSALDIQIPRLSQAHRMRQELESITTAEIKKAFSQYNPLPLGKERGEEIPYEGRHLITNEIIEQMRLKVPLLKTGIGAISYFREMIERAIHIQGTHAKLAPLIQTFLTEILFEQKVGINDPRLISRLADGDVREHLLAVFLPLTRAKIMLPEEKRVIADAPLSVTQWKPFQATSSERHPVLTAERTPFNLVTCNRDFEVAFARFVNERAQNVAAFCKNAGPQALRIDYLARGGRLAFYTPDFFVRMQDGLYYLAETKGEEDLDVPAKARAAQAWCESVSQSSGEIWKYLYLPENIFYSYRGSDMAELARMCEPALNTLVAHIRQQNPLQDALPFFDSSETQREERISEFISPDALKKLSSRAQKCVEEAISLFNFMQNKDMNLSPCFTPLLGPLDELATSLIIRQIKQDMPLERVAQNNWFNPDMRFLSERDRTFYSQNANNLKRMLVYNNGVMPLGLLAFCLSYPSQKVPLDGVFKVLQKRFSLPGAETLAKRLETIKDFRNTYVAHQPEELKDTKIAKKMLGEWIGGLIALNFNKS